MILKKTNYVLVKYIVIEWSRNNSVKRISIEVYLDVRNNTLPKLYGFLLASFTDNNTKKQIIIIKCLITYKWKDKDHKTSVGVKITNVKYKNQIFLVCHLLWILCSSIS